MTTWRLKRFALRVIVSNLWLIFLNYSELILTNVLHMGSRCMTELKAALIYSYSSLTSLYFSTLDFLLFSCFVWFMWRRMRWQPTYRQAFLLRVHFLCLFFMSERNTVLLLAFITQPSLFFPSVTCLSINFFHFVLSTVLTRLNLLSISSLVVVLVEILGFTHNCIYGLHLHLFLLLCCT